MKDLPYRFREAAFKRYEGVIASVVAAYPACVDFKPREEFGLSPTTFSCRLRDAMRSAIDNKWPTSRFDLMRLMQIHDDIQVAERNDVVKVGSKEQVREAAPLQVDVEAYKAATSSPIELLNDAEKVFLCRLIIKGVLATPLIVHGLTEIDTECLQQTFDLAIIPNKDGSHTIL